MWTGIERIAYVLPICMYWAWPKLASQTTLTLTLNSQPPTALPLFLFQAPLVVLSQPLLWSLTSGNNLCRVPPVHTIPKINSACFRARITYDNPHMKPRRIISRVVCPHARSNLRNAQLMRRWPVNNTHVALKHVTIKSSVTVRSAN
jgi:hypothetical protein